jgi:2-polyprenyl-3-methyl-5-hydroxy-6-metoxy-1,4-benzoquinol methylase
MKNKYNWKPAACDLCGSNKTSIYIENLTTWEHKGEFNLVKCEICELIFLSPRPGKSIIGKYYPSDYWNSRKEVNWKNIRDKIFRPVYKILLENKVGKILDVGAGDGTFLSKFKENGWFVNGVEVSRDAVKIAKDKYKIQLINGDFEKIHINDTYDVITFMNSLEHLYSPKNALRKANTALVKDGLLLVSVPNIGSLGSLIFRKNWYPLSPPRHLYHFSINTITDMLSKCGFKVMIIEPKYYIHHFDNIFNSFRYMLSPKYIRRKYDITKNTNKKERYVKSLPIIMKVTFKTPFIILSHTLSVLESITGKGEVVIIVAKKI